MQAQIRVTEHHDVLSEFRRKLQSDWKRMNFDGKVFYVRGEIHRWMKSGSPTNAVHLLVKVNQQFKGGRFPIIKSSDLFEPEMCVMVFAILLSIGYGHLIHIFHQHGVTDQKLEINIPELESLYRPLYDDLKSEHVNAKDVITAFEERKWAFNPLPLTLMMHPHKKGTDWILPFAKCKEIAKGGTATVYQVLVQEDLLPGDFRNAISAGRVQHESLTKVCYQFAIKEYTKANETDFKRECEAFMAIRGQEGMVQYLGRFVLDRKDADGRRVTTYNILLEYGEFDLEEFFNEPQQYPPVLHGEIVFFWESFFKIADAISRVHNLKIETEDGQTKVYNGWHADIKPENILRVYGEFKLADFGFAKFSDFKGGGPNPTSFIDGFTAAYGAPETDISRLLQGTLTPMSQTIDTWSLGCVLSITATWVILGVQGVMQFRQVRSAAIAKLDQNQRPSSLDCFHNRHVVLPEVLDWHRLLRASMRKCDPITDTILDLIEKRMWLADPRERIQCKDLCKKLDNFLEEAHNACHRPENAMISVMTTLLEFDRKAPSTASEAEEIAKQNQGGGRDSNLRHQQLGGNLAIPDDTTRPKSKRFAKPSQVIVQGKFAHRTLALETALRVSGHSIAPRPSTDPDPMDIDHVHIDNMDIDQTPVSQQYEVDRIPTVGYRGPSAVRPHASVSYAGNAGITGPSRAATPPPILFMEPGDMTPRATATPKQDPTKPSPRSPVSPNEPDYHTTGTPDLTEHGPLHIQQPVGPSEKSATPRTTPIVETFGLPTSGSPSTPRTPVTVPKLCPDFSPYDDMEQLDEAICKQRIMLDKAKKAAGWLRKPKEDTTLKQRISNRDFVFVVDRAPTMVRSWEWVTFVVETLAMKLARLDEDGLDLVFTSSSEYNRWGVKDASKFRTAIQRARPGPDSPKTDMSRCIGELTRQARPHLSSLRYKQLTLIIVTDGLWGLATSASGQIPADEKIVNFLKDLQKEVGASLVEDRCFSIQFISFATNPKAHEHLDYLDSGLAKKYNIPDVIDTKPWNHPHVHHLILGSIDKYLDDPDGDAESDMVGGDSQAGPSASSSQSLVPPSRNLSPSPSRRGTGLSRSRSGRSTIGSLFKKS